MSAIGWAITGAGHELTGIYEIMSALNGIEIFQSDAAVEVCKMYKVKLDGLSGKIYNDITASSPVCGRFATGHYKTLVIAPASGNSVAKFVYGIADTLVTNIFAQATKSGVPVIVFPTDVAPEMDTMSPTGMVKVYPRKIDLENTDRLSDIENVTVVKSLDELRVTVSEKFG